jgi:hypothetical protein
MEIDGIIVADSITKLDDSWRGQVAIAASHGGVYACYLAAKAQLRGVILHDAGLGLDRAGIAGLDYLDALGLAAATVGHLSARIGDGADVAARGIISHVNAAAAKLGCAPGELCRSAAAKLLAGAAFTGVPPAYEESRFRLRDGDPPVWGIDSASLVRPDDRGAIIVAGSHGGVLGSDAASALRVDALAAVFHDAGIGIDRAGLGRLGALDARGIAGATVAGDTARIGDARSLWATGRLSAVNPTAAARGARIGMSVPDFADAVGKK